MASVCVTTETCFYFMSSVLSLPLQFIEEAGFSSVQAEDRTPQFIQVIKTELQRAEAIKDEFIEVSMDKYTCTLARKPAKAET